MNQSTAAAQTSAAHWVTPDEESSQAFLSGDTGQRIEQLAKELARTKAFIEAGIDPANRVLFSGPSGTGKTLVARWLGWKLRLQVCIVDLSACQTPYHGQTAQNLSACFQEAAKKPSLLFLDELDGVASSREGMGNQSCDREDAHTTLALVQALDWAKPEAAIIAATNFPQRLDPAIKRRFSTHIEFELPDRDARRKMLGLWLKRAPFSESELDALAEATNGMAGADLRSRAMSEARARILAQPVDVEKELSDLRRRKAEIQKGCQALLAGLEGAARA